MFVAKVARDASDPARKSSRVAKPTNPSPRHQERLLGHLIARFELRSDAQGNRPNHREVSPHQSLEGRRVSALRLTHQVIEG